MTAPTLASQSLGNVETISYDKDPNIILLSFPGSDSSAAEVYDLMGVTKTITINGVFTGSNVAAVKALVDAIDTLCDGNQTSTVSLVSDEIGTLSVMVGPFTVTWDVAVCAARYQLKLYQGVTS
jgi:hypothetical protein